MRSAMNPMSLIRKLAFFLAFLSLVAFAVPGGSGGSLRSGFRPNAARANEGSVPASDAATVRVDWALKHQPVSFIENRGQIDPRVAYYVEGAGTTMYFTSDGVIFALPQKQE